MYRINNLNRPTLITPDEVIFHAAIDATPDARQILQNIIIAEERYIAQALGDDFYEELLNLKNVTVTQQNQDELLVKINESLAAAGKVPIAVTNIPVGSIINAIEFITNPNYLMLWNRFLWKLTSEAVDQMCIVPSWLRHTAQGQQKNNPEVIGGNQQGSASGDLKDVKYKVDVWIRERIDPLTERMHQWLCKNKTKIPSYDKHCDCSEDGISLERKTAFVFGAYDQRDNNCGCSKDAIKWVPSTT